MGTETGHGPEDGRPEGHKSRVSEGSTEGPEMGDLHSMPRQPEAGGQLDTLFSQPEHFRGDPGRDASSNYGARETILPEGADRRTTNRSGIVHDQTDGRGRSEDAEDASSMTAETACGETRTGVVSALTSPGTLGGAGMAVVAAPFSWITAAVYTVSTAVTFRNELRARDEATLPSPHGDLPADEPRGLISRVLQSPGIIFKVGSAVAAAQGAEVLANANSVEEVIAGCAWMGVVAGTAAFAALCNRQADYALFPHKESGIGKLISKVSSIIPDRVKQIISNPVVGLSISNVLFSATAPGALSEGPQLAALSVGALLGLAGIIRGLGSDGSALGQSLGLGGGANAALATNAFLGGDVFTGSALTLWTLQNLSAFMREGDK